MKCIASHNCIRHRLLLRLLLQLQLVLVVMVNVDIDKELYEDIKRAVQKKKYHYSSIKFFVQKAIYNELVNSKTFSDNNFDEIYSRLK